MDDSYVAVYQEEEKEPCGAMPLELALGILPELHKRTGINYHAQFITRKKASEIRRNITQDNYETDKL